MFLHTLPNFGWLTAAIVTLLSASSEASVGRTPPVLGGPIINTRYGAVRGKYADVGHNAQVSVFLRIPFALPPVGSLRFADPVPSQPWAPEVLDATQMGAACFQIDDDRFPGFRGAEMWNSRLKSEDCLHLNIWTKKNVSRRDRLAVMVWIYGGSFYSGSTMLDVYDGSTLAGAENVIVVSLNYRLGPLGFLPPMAGVTSGNAGFLDQILALKWIRDNIVAFGGDPNRITLFGESAGAASIGLHTVSPLSRGLFNRIILQSGNQISRWSTINMETSKGRMREMARNMKCINNENDDEARILECLRSAHEESIFNNSWVTSAVFQFPFVPVVGTSSLPRDPREVTNKGDQADVDALIGWNSNEGSYFNIYALQGFNIHSESIISKDLYMKELRKCGLNLDAVGLEAVAFFYSDWKNPSNPLQYRDALDQINTDYHIVCPTLELAKLHRRQGNVYVYHLSYRVSNNDWPKWMGVMHGYEIELVFGMPMSYTDSHKYNNEDRQVAGHVVRYWTNFAKYGNPNGLANRAEFGLDSSPNVDPYWPAVSSDQVTYLELAGSRSYVRQSPNSLQCAFWNKYVPSLQATSQGWSETESRWKLQFHRWEDSMDSWERSFERYTRKQNKRKENMENNIDTAG